MDHYPPGIKIKKMMVQNVEFDVLGLSKSLKLCLLTY